MKDQKVDIWESKFDKKFNGYWRGNSIPDEIKFFIKTNFIAKSEMREKIEKMKRKEGGEWEVGVDDGMGFDEAIPFNKALQDLLEELE